MKISLNFILKATNLLILFLAIYFYNNIGVTTYVNGTIIILCAILGIQTHLFLSYAKEVTHLKEIIVNFDKIF